MSFINDRYRWFPLDNHWGRELVATADGRTCGEFHIKLPNGRSASTHNSEEWPIVERYVPRREWPSCMYAGKVGRDDRQPDLMVQAVVRGFEADI